MKKFSTRLILVWLSALLATGQLAASDVSSCGLTLEGQAREIEVMAYNVENLFDTEHDEGKEDYEYLPLNHPLKSNCKYVQNEYYRKACQETDWNEDKLKRKIEQIDKAVRKYRGGVLPDILVLEEVENENVLIKLKNALGFKNHFITNGPDERGIDVAIVFNERIGLSFENVHYHQLKGPLFSGKKALKTRDILEVQFRVGGEKLSVFANHWPSQGKGPQYRVAVAEEVKAIVDGRSREGRLSLLAGDFNTLEGEVPHAFKDVLYKGNNPLWNIHSAFVGSFGPLNFEMNGPRLGLPKGTSFYGKDMTWSVLDHFFASEGLRDNGGLEIDLESYKIFDYCDLKRDFYKQGSETEVLEEGVPRRYSHNLDPRSPKQGFSDHFPISIKLKY